MTEKEIKETNVSGKKVEDLTDEELEVIQGQGDTSGELIMSYNPINNIVSKLIKCRK